MSNDILRVLMDEHREVASSLEKLETMEDPSERSPEFAKLRANLMAHSKAEHEVLYTRIQNEEPTHDIVLEGIQEHHVVTILLKELSEMNMLGETWLAKLKVLKENVEHHVDEEEDDMFPKARGILKPDERAQLCEAYEQRRDEILDTLHPLEDLEKEISKESKNSKNTSTKEKPNLSR